MKRTLRRVEIGQNRVRYKVTVTGFPCHGKSRSDQLKFLQNIIETPGLLDCGLNQFQRLTVFYNGEQWQADAEAEIDEPMGAG
jgi:hypothetical protein